MFTGFARTIILYLLIIAGVRLMGKRQVGELEPSELVLSLIIADLASVPMQDFGIPLLTGVIPILTLLSLTMILSVLTMKSVRFRALMCGRPSIIIRDGNGRKPIAVNPLQKVFVGVKIADHIGCNTIAGNLLACRAGNPVAHHAAVLRCNDRAVIIIEKVLTSSRVKQVLLFLKIGYPINIRQRQVLNRPVQQEVQSEGKCQNDQYDYIKNPLGISSSITEWFQLNKPPICFFAISV